VSDKPATFDPAAWTGPPLPEWPKPGDHPHPRPIHAKQSWIKSAAAACLLLAAGCIVFLPGHRKEPGLFVQLAAVAALLGGLALAWKSYRAWQHSEVALVLDARGLSWPEVFEITVPWSEIVEVDYRKPFRPGMGIPGLYIKIRDHQRFKPKWAKTRFGIDLSKVDVGLPLSSMLDVDTKTLFRTVQAYRAHFGKGGLPMDA
jgi:hypothetical protein